MSPAVLHTSAALREIEQRAALRFGDPFELMRRAGRAAWQAVMQHWPHAQSLLVICGPGNNGGDGYVLATLARASGRRVQVCCLPDHEPRTDECRRARQEYVDAGGELVAGDGALPAADLLVDALFGIGLTRELQGPVAALVERINALSAPVLALDVPSGVVADTGSVGSVAVMADLTLEFIAAKAGLRTGGARDFTGGLHVADLGLEPTDLRSAQADVAWLRAPDLAHWLRPRRRDSHKGSNGRLLCIGGDHGHGGAIMLAAEAALRAGSGLVDVVTREAHVAPLLTRLPEAMVHGDSDGEDNSNSNGDSGGTASSGLDSLISDASAIVIGPGLGQGAWGRERLRAICASGLPVVLDADALNLIAAGVVAAPANAVLTPHPGEAARLLQTGITEVQRDRFAAARAIASRYQAVVVFKGAGTIVSEPCGNLSLIDAGNPGMAVGGMGDVLSGVIGALLAQGLPLRDAAVCGALLHSVAADSAAADGGERGLLPSDLMCWLRCHANRGAR
ncbi:NAD(P)H-hydrate dehydratase [Lysobacter ciconiae]|uniref:Bifunctional NAD(P)H-hydrate repair enzyme n=1 Tax=Novilysobacter ciconiae TaxID=2781022 RepID=A0A7S6UEF9_9GAMM|nr:NAD(P)H-hydrate dehydratase [Lysobacter ciconiae]QOW18760.1 NAD(P)H-hydrate dehydratase [Lysobacter ciconiae]